MPVHGQRAPGWYLIAVGSGHDHGLRPPHLRMQQADGILFGIVGAE